MNTLWTVEVTYPAAVDVAIPEGAEALSGLEETRVLYTVHAPSAWRAIETCPAIDSSAALAIAVYPTPDGYSVYSGPAASLIAIPSPPT